MPSSRSCASSTGAGAPVSGSAPEAVFGNAITSRIESAPEQPLDDAVEPVGDPSVRRRAVAQRLEQEAEPLLGLVRRRSRSPRRPAPGAAGRRCGSSRRPSPARSRRCRRRRPAPRRAARGRTRPAGAVNGWWSGSQRDSSSFHSNIGQSTTHTKRSPSPISSKRSRELEPQLRRAPRWRPSASIGDQQQQVPLLGAERLVERAQLVGGEELRGRRAPARRPRGTPRRAPSRRAPGRARSARRAPSAAGRGRPRSAP